jgi:REP element-mobilizing transposase RayT
LACPEAHEALINAWKQAELWRVGRYVIMPDHIHFFCGPGSVDPIRLGTWMTYWKQCFTKSGVLAENRPIWQSGHWDRQVRGLENYSAKWQYVQENPVRHGLVAKAEDWPYQGEIESLEMIDLN